MRVDGIDRNVKFPVSSSYGSVNGNYPPSAQI